MSGSATTSRTRKILIAGAAVGALVVAPLTAWAVVGDFEDVPPSHPAYRSVTSVAGAGVMGGDAENRFRPGAKVKRAGLATVLHRGLSRLAVDDTVADIPADTSDPALIAAVNIGIDGLEPGNQGVLLQQTMQVETAAPLAADCELTLVATSTPENFDVGLWTTHLYAGTRGGDVQAVFSDSQLAGALYTYEIAAQHDCGQALGVVQGALVGQTAALTGNGQPFPE